MNTDIFTTKEVFDLGTIQKGDIVSFQSRGIKIYGIVSQTTEERVMISLYESRTGRRDTVSIDVEEAKDRKLKQEIQQQ